MNLPQVDAITKAIESLNANIGIVPGEDLAIGDAAGRILATDIVADRDSPALDVSAMDGYAIRKNDISDQEIKIAETTTAGSAPSSLPVGQAVQVFTGAGVPKEADCVIKREDTSESKESVRFHVNGKDVADGLNIRRRGENLGKGEVVLPSGRLLNPPSMASLASFGSPSIFAYRKLRVSILNTGDELVQMGEPVEQWQIRDSNGPTLETLLGKNAWVEIAQRKRIKDTLEDVVRELQAAMELSDAVIMTGGVSMGDTDYVPDAIERIGGQIVFHRLPLRPGRPVLGACFEGKPIIGLPGNPVSVAVTAKVIAMPVLQKAAGLSQRPQKLFTSLSNPDEKSIGLTWFRLVRTGEDGMELVPSRGSGDVVSLGASEGFVRLEPGATGPGPWPLYLW